MAPYVTEEELKTILGVQNETYADAALEIAVNAAKEMIDGYMDTRFDQHEEVRFYEPGRYDHAIRIDDLLEAESVTVDTAGDGSYGTVWELDTHYYLDPPNATASGVPSRELVLNRRSGARFSRYPRGLRIEGTFGWAEVPWAVKQASVLIANRLLARTRSAPLGVLAVQAGDAVAAARLGRVDPDVANLLENIPGIGQSGLTSIQLG